MMASVQVKSALEQIERHFTRDAWEKDESIQVRYKECLFQLIPHCDISDHLEKLLPPALMLADHHDLEKRMLGVQCLDRIVSNVSQTELSWYGRAEVILDCLQRAMYTHNAALVDVLHPCLIKVLAATNSHPTKAISKQSHYDEIFCRLIRDMQMENKLDMRLAYSHILPLYITALGLAVLKYIKAFLRMTFSYLEVYDGPHEETRLNILASLRLVLLECWPRIPAHSEQIIKGLFRLIYDITNDNTRTPDNIKESVIQKAVECLVLLKRANPQRSVPLLEALHQLELGTNCHQYIDKVLVSD